MAEKKNVNLDNMLSDDELGMVSGGTADEGYNNNFVAKEKKECYKAPGDIFVVGEALKK